MQRINENATTASQSQAVLRRRILIAAPAVLLLAGLLWALRPAAVLVDVAPVTQGPMRVTVDEEGKTRVKQIYVVSAPVSGKLRRSPLDPGDAIVKDKSVIAVIEPAAPLFLDERARKEVEAQIVAARSSVSLAQAEVRQGEVDLEWATSELERSRTLARTSAVSRRTLERSGMDVERQHAVLARAKSNLDLKRAELASAEARLIGPENPGATYGSGAGCCVEVRSPVNGQILRELQESEKIVLAGSPLFEIGDPADIEIMVDLLSADAVRIQPGADATMEGTGLAGLLKARVRRIEPAGFTKVSALGVEEQRVRTFLDLEPAPGPSSARLGHEYR
jgi:HlyD family secretion protein